MDGKTNEEPMAIKQPAVRDKTNTDPLTDRMIEFLSKLKGQIINDNSNRQQWTNKMIIAQNQRLGIKRYSDYPYPGAPDIPLPETDKLIKKQLPNLVLSAWSPKDLCVVSVAPGWKENPEWEQKAKKTQSAMNTVLRSPRMQWFKKLYLAADYKKTYGHAIFKVREEFCSRMVTKVIELDSYPKEEVAALKKLTNAELRAFIAERFFLDMEDEADKKSIDEALKQFRSGEDVIEFQVEEIESYPTIDIPLPTKVIVPNYTTDLSKAQRITFEYFLSRQELEAAMDKGIFRKKDIDTLKIATGDEDLVERQKMMNEGISDNSADMGELYRIHETLTWYRENDDDPLQRWVFVSLADIGAAEEALLQDNDYPYEFDEWNYEKVDEEIKDARYYNSRGIPEQNRAYQEVMERCINNMLIRDEMVNTPMYEVLATSDLLDDSVRFVPGRKLPVKAIGTEIAPVGTQSIPDMSSARILETIKAYVEEYQSSSDFLFRNATNAGGGKTLGEIELGVRQNAQPIQLEVINWIDTLSKVYQKMFDIMKDRVGDSMYIDDMEITKEDFNFPAEVRCNGDLEIADQTMTTQKALMRVQMMMNPAFADIVDSEDRYNIIRDWLEKDGVKDPDKFCTDPKTIMQGQLAQMKQQLQQGQQQLMQMQEAGKKGQQELLNQKKKTEQEKGVQQFAESQINEMVESVIGKGGEELNGQA